VQYSQAGEGTPREALLEFVWALLNSAEFLDRH